MNDPLSVFNQWFAEAGAAGLQEPEAMHLATVRPDGRPAGRVVLLKDWDAEGFTFYTNYTSAKADELAVNPFAALTLHWAPMQRQIRIEGVVRKVARATSEAYFATRPRLSQVGAWASRQSRPLEGPLKLEREVMKAGARFLGREVPCPPFWGGYKVFAETIEFWEGKPFRRHHRYRREKKADGSWETTWLFP